MSFISLKHQGKMSVFGSSEVKCEGITLGHYSSALILVKNADTVAEMAIAVDLYSAMYNSSLITLYCYIAMPVCRLLIQCH